MSRHSATTLLRRLEHDHVAPKGEVVVDLERAAAQGAASPEPVLLLTDAALYASRASARSWVRLPLDKIRQVTVSTDPSGMLTRYRVVDAGGDVWFDVALPMARSSFRARMEQLSRRDATTGTPRVVPAHAAAALASMASLASARTLVSSAASAATLVSAASITPVTSVRVA